MRRDEYASDGDIMKKILILISFILLTGCSVNYSIDIDKNDERIRIIFDDNYITGNLDKELDRIIEINSDETSLAAYYKFDKIINNRDVGLNLSYTYNSVTNYKDVSPFIKCYQNVNININDDIANIDISGFTNCDEQIDNGIISIKVKGKLINTNADKIKNETYYWDFNKNKDIKLQVDRSHSDDSIKYIIVVGSVVAIILVIVVALFAKNKANNQI